MEQKNSKLFLEVSHMLATATCVEDGVNCVISYLGKKLHVSRVYIFERLEKDYASNTFEWCDTKIIPHKDVLKRVNCSKNDYSVLFTDSSIFCCPDVENADEDIKALFAYQGVKAALLYAILDNGKFYGFIGINDHHKSRPDWENNPEELNMLSFVANLLSFYLIKERNLEQSNIAHEETLLMAARFQENLTIINEIIQSGIWYVNFNERGEQEEVCWSDNFCSMLGFDGREKLKNTMESWTERLHPDDKDEVVSRFYRGISGEREYDVTYRIRMKNDKYEWFRMQGKCVRYKNGQPRIFIGTFINITEQKNADSDINGRLSALLGGVNGGLKISQNTTYYPYIYVSDEVAALQGYTVQEFMEVSQGTTIGNVSSEDVLRIGKQMEKQFEEGDTYSINYRVKHKDGRWIWVHDYGKKILTPDGREVVYSLLQDITEQEKANQELQIQAAQIKRLNEIQEQLTDNFPSGIFAYTLPDYDVLIANEEIYRLFNYAPDMNKSLTGAYIMERVIPEDLALVRAASAKIKKVGDEVEYTFRTYLLDGELAYIYCITRMRQFDDGTKYIVSGVQDVTETVVLRNKIEEERRQFRDALIKNSVYHYTFDVTKGTIDEDFVTSNGIKMLASLNMKAPIDFDEASRRYMQVADVQFLDEYASCCFSKEGLISLYENNLANKGRDFYEKKKDAYYQIQPFFVKDAKNEHLICTLICSDISNERKKEIEQKRTMEEKLKLQQLLIEEERQTHRRDMILQILSREYTSVYYIDIKKDKMIPFRVDKAHNVMNFKELEEMPFYSLMEEYIRKTVVPEELEEMLSYMQADVLKNCLSDRDTFTHIYRIEQDGQRLYMQMRIARPYEEEELCHIVIGFAVVDKEVRAEQKKQEQLREALLAAEQANTAKTLFLNNMSHDIRTPMNAIIGFTELATENADNTEKVLDYLKKIQVSGNHLMSLINDVLDMSRIESGKVKIEESDVFLPEIFNEVKNIVQVNINSKNLKFDVEMIDLKHEFVCCDRLRLNQVLLNCISNAIKFTPKGGCIGLTMIEDFCDEEGYAKYRFLIKDTGIGMSQEFVGHIFEPFERERTSTVSGIQGTGLGMSITKNIVDMMNGRISVTSEKNVGTEFEISLKFRISSKNFDEITALKKTDGEYSVEGIRILLVEDNEMNREIATEILTSKGAIVNLACNGAEAVKYMKESINHPYDIVLMDVQMPVMDGYEATRNIRELPEDYYKEIPIVAMTANAFEEDRKKAYEVGMNAHIPKPISVNNVVETISTVIRQKLTD